MTDVSVIIVNYNTFKLTCQCIESIYKHTDGITLEIVLVDNASTECDANLFKARFNNIILITNKENVGFAKGNNVGIRFASGKTILLLNSDTELLGNSILLSYQSLLKTHAKVVTGKLLFPDGRMQYQCGRFPSIMLQLIELFRVQKLMSKHQRENIMLGTFFDHERPLYPDWIWGTYFHFDRSALKSFPDKKLTETYFMYQEDLEWCYYINTDRRSIYYNPEIQVIHFFSSSSPSAELQKKKYDLLTANYIHFLHSHYGKVYTSIYLFLQKLNKKLQLRKSTLKF